VANPFKGARVLTDGHFAATRCFFLLTTTRLLRQLFALPKFLAVTAPMHVILQLKAITSVREVSKRLSWWRYGLARKTNCPSRRTVGGWGCYKAPGSSTISVPPWWLQGNNAHT